MLTLQKIEFAYQTDGEVFSVTTTKTVSTPDMTFTVEKDGDTLRTQIHAEKEICLLGLKAYFTCPLTEQDAIFLNGYQSWTDSYEHSIHEKMHGLERVPAVIAEKYAFRQYGDYSFADYPNHPGQLHGFSYGYIRNRADYRFFGSLCEDSGFTLFRTDANQQLLTAEKDCKGVSIQGDFDGLCLLLTEGKENTVFDRYFALLGVQLREGVQPIYGYTSWYRHYPNISERIILDDLEGLQTQPHKADVFQIDDGYQTAVGDWLSVDANKFPEGMEKIAASIREAGYLPGLWMAPFACEVNSELYRNHPDWLVKDANGQPVRGGSNWSGFYALDIYNAEFRDYLKEVFRTVVQEWGYGLLKLDFLYAACILPRRDKTRGMVMADAMDFLREIAGDAFILGCGVPLASAFGRVDYCRIGCDVSLDWDDKPHMRLAHRERVSTKTTILDSVFRRQLNGRAFLNDPDVFLLRSDQNGMTAEQRTCLAEVNALCGGVLFTSDNAALYDDDQKRILQRMMNLRKAEVVHAEYHGGLLKLHIRYQGKLIARVYPM